MNRGDINVPLESPPLRIEAGSPFRFSGFDGLRGWLAWTVVIHHIVLYTGLSHRFPALQFIHPLGDGAVSIFIIMSGFVLTHLIVEKPEPYRLYIARRLLRIYPIYVVALAMGVAATLLNHQTFMGLPQQQLFHVPDLHRLELGRASLQDHFALHLGLHALLMHGAVPTSSLYESQYMFLAPAWSLSLESQFYLVAPLVTWAARRKWPSIGLAFLAAGLFHAYQRQKFGVFVLPSFLPGAALLFAAGIASRLLLAPARARGSWVALLIVATTYLYDRQPLGPIVIWAVFFSASLGKLGTSVTRVFHSVFDSATARRLGIPSYSTYLLHMPILQAAQYLAARQLGLSAAEATTFVVVATSFLTYSLSQLTYRWIEAPAVRFGRRLGRAPVGGVPLTADPSPR